MADLRPWDEIAGSPEYQALPPDRQQKVADAYHGHQADDLKPWDDIVGSHEYQALTPEKQQRVRTRYIQELGDRGVYGPNAAKVGGQEEIPRPVGYTPPPVGANLEADTTSAPGEMPALSDKAALLGQLTGPLRQAGPRQDPMPTTPRTIPPEVAHPTLGDLAVQKVLAPAAQYGEAGIRAAQRPFERWGQAVSGAVEPRLAPYIGQSAAGKVAGLAGGAVQYAPLAAASALTGADVPEAGAAGLWGLRALLARAAGPAMEAGGLPGILARTGAAGTTMGGYEAAGEPGAAAEQGRPADPTGAAERGFAGGAVGHLALGEAPSAVSNLVARARMARAMRPDVMPPGGEETDPAFVRAAMASEAAGNPPTYDVTPERPQLAGPPPTPPEAPAETPPVAPPTAPPPAAPSPEALRAYTQMRLRAGQVPQGALSGPVVTPEQATALQQQGVPIQTAPAAGGGLVASPAESAPPAPVEPPTSPEEPEGVPPPIPPEPKAPPPPPARRGKAGAGGPSEPSPYPPGRSPQDVLRSLAEIQSRLESGTNPKGRTLTRMMLDSLRQQGEQYRQELAARGVQVPELPARPSTPTPGPVAAPAAQKPSISGPALPPEVEAVVRGEAPAWLRPPAAEGTVPTQGERALQGMDLRQTAEDRGMGYYRAKDGTEVLYDPKQVRPRDLGAMERAGKLPEIVNGPGTAPKPANPKAAVITREPGGQEVRTVLTDTPEATRAAVAAQPPSLTTEVRPADQAIPDVLAQRRAPTQEELGQQGIRTITSPEGYQHAVGLHGWPELVDIGGGHYGRTQGALFRDEAGAPVAYAPPEVQPGYEPPKPPITPGPGERQIAQSNKRAQSRLDRMVQQHLGEPSTDPDVRYHQQIVASLRDSLERAGQAGDDTWAEKTKGRLHGAIVRLGEAQKAAEEHAAFNREWGGKEPEPPATPPKRRKGKSTTLGTGFGSLGDLSDAVTSVRKAWERTRRRLPMETAVLGERPESAAISEVDRWNAERADAIERRVNEPWHQGVQSADPEQMKDAEKTAVDYWKAHGETPDAEAASRYAFPPDVQRSMELRDALFEQANQARAYFGLDPISKQAGPYLPRRVVEGRQAVTIGSEYGGGNRALRTGPGGHAAERHFDTYRAGEQAGMEYDDPRNQIITRDYDDLTIIQTQRLFQNLERKGVLFRDRDEAKAASPTGRPFLVENAPGGEWWTPTEAEARFLAQNLSQSSRGPDTSLQGHLSAIFRQPNLVDPFPHILKNMGSNAILARGPLAPAAMVRDGIEWARGSNPEMLREFDEWMPASKSGRTAEEIFGGELHRGALADMLQGAKEKASILNRPSQTAVFKVGDPIARYCLFKYYRGQGMEPPEAAAHATIDLVRYGTRSDLTDIWKSRLLNFFVPWRVGAITALLKNAAYHPVRTALLVGAMDYLREMNRRYRGKWFTLPWDGLEAPIAQLAQSKNGVDFLGNVTKQAVLTRFFGPGGAYAASQINDLLKLVTDKGSAEDIARMKNLFWGIRQIYNLPEEYQKGDYSGMLATAFLGERDALKYPPTQLWAQHLPEWLPGMQKAPAVKAAERGWKEQAEDEADREALAPVRKERKEALKRLDDAVVQSQTGGRPDAVARALQQEQQRKSPLDTKSVAPYQSGDRLKSPAIRSRLQDMLAAQPGPQQAAAEKLADQADQQRRMERLGKAPLGVRLSPQGEKLRQMLQAPAR